MYKNLFKRFFDLFFSLLSLPIIFILIIIIGIIIITEDKGPIFYNAERLGIDGKKFEMYKFRSMKVDSPDIRNEDGSTFNSDNDPRLTKIGKLLRKSSLDEIPQVINVILGHMSFVGPRPDLPEHIFLYEGNEKRKLEVRPGITGYNQAYFRNSLPWKERIKNDIYYIDNITLFFDIKILIQTIKSVIFSRNVFQSKR